MAATSAALAAAATPTAATPGGPVVAVLLCLAPVLFLLATSGVCRRLRLRSAVSLPLAAVLLAVVRLAYLSSPPLLVAAHALLGVADGLVPLAVLWGAILLFETMAVTGCLPFLLANVRCLCGGGNPLAEVMLIGWAFAFTISGVSGFSTPMALAAPMLVSLGHDPLASLAACCALNALSAHLGSVGMAVWFGFGNLPGLSHVAILHIGTKSAVVIGLCSFMVVPAAASLLVPWRELACSAGFLCASIASAVVPTIVFSLFSAEFPSVIGGLTSFGVTWLLIKYRIGLRPRCATSSGTATAADVEAGCDGDASKATPSGPADASPLPPLPTSVVVVSDAASAASTPRSVAAASCLRGDSCPSMELSPFQRVQQQQQPKQPKQPGNKTAVAAEPATPTATAPGGCIFKCDSCTSDQITRAVEAALQRQASLPSTPAPCGAGAQRSKDAAPPTLRLHLPVPAALSVVSHQSGEHVVISGVDRLSSTLRLLLEAAAGSSNGQTISLAPPLPAAVAPLEPGEDAAAAASDGTAQDGSATTATARVRRAPLSLLLKRHSAAAYEEYLSQADPLAGVSAAAKLPVSLADVVLRTLPLWLTVLLLLVTHVPQLRLQDMLRSLSPAVTLHMGNLADLRLSAALVLQLQHLLTWPTATWTLEALYIPCFCPFVLASLATLAVHRRDMAASGASWATPFASAAAKVSGIVPALLAAIALAQLMSAGGAGSPAFLVAYWLTTWLGRGYLALAGVIGGVGAFASGSVLSSNLMQGGIQLAAAGRLGVPATSLLALQTAGACAGKLVCLSSILSAKVAVAELRGTSECEVVRRTAPLALLLVLLSTGLSAVWTATGLWPDA